MRALRVLTLSVAANLALISVALADGQETGLLVGRVTSNFGASLPGVQVSVSAGRELREVFTDQEGNYRFALLVPDEYTVTASMDGFDAATQVARVSGGGKSQLDFEMTLSTSETITVTMEAPMVDKFNVTAGTTVSSEIGQETAGSTRTYYGVINTLPGVASDPDNDDIQGTRPSVNGSHWADQQVFVDGVDTSFARYGGSRVYIPTSAVTEVAMEAGGSGAEYGRAIGSTTNVIVKSGTNQFHSDAMVQRQEVDWAADYKDHPEFQNRQNFPRRADQLRRTPEEKERSSTGFELSLGGSLRRDKAWFFLAWADIDTNDLEKALNGDPIEASLATEARIAKINLQPAGSHSIAASWIETPASRNYAPHDAGDYWTPTLHFSDGTLGTVAWNYSITSDFFLEAKIASQKSDENKFLACGSTDPAVCLALKQEDRGPTGEGPLRFPANPQAGPHWPGNNYSVYIDLADDYSWHNGWLLDNGFGVNEFPREQANVSLTQFAGDQHELKYGIDWQTVQWKARIQGLDRYDGSYFEAQHPFGFRSASGGIGQNDCGIARTDGGTVDFLNSLGVPQAFFGSAAERALGICAYTRLIPDAEIGSGNTENEDLAVYLRDRFTVGDHWTFNLGLRYENSVARNDIDRKVVDADNLAPRLSASYDLRGDGKMIVAANVGRYYAQLNQQWIQQHLLDHPNGGLYQSFETILFCDALDVALTTALDPGSVPGCERGVGYNFSLRSYQAGRMWQLVDEGLWQSDIRPYYKDEIVLGFEWQVAQNWALDTKLIQWELGDMIGATVQASPYGDLFTFVANYDDYSRILTDLEDARIALGQEPLFPDRSVLDEFREGETQYRAVQLQLNRRFNQGWALYNNVTFSETETTGNGDWANNTNADYGEELHVTLREDDIASCVDDQTRPSLTTGNLPVVPVIDECRALSRYLGQSVSTINRKGRARNQDRPIIWNIFGFKTWSLPRGHDLTVGGHFSLQSGLPWQREGAVGTIAPDGNEAASSSVGLYIEPRGTRRLSTTHQINLSVNWGFPITARAKGGLRIEGLNVTNEQKNLNVWSDGEVLTVRRWYQRPRQIRASLALRF